MHKATAVQKSGLRPRLKEFYGNYGYLISFLLMVVVARYFNSRFLTYNNLTNLLVQASIKGVIALGATFCLTAGMFDLSLGAEVALIAGTGVLLLNSTGSIVLMLLYCLIAGCILGTLNGLLVTKGSLPPFIATLATQVSFRSIIVQLGQSGPFNVQVRALRKIASGDILGVPNYALAFIVFTVIAALLMNRTKFGRYVTGIGSNTKAAKLAGVNVDKIKVLCYIVAGVCAGISAFMLTARLTSITASNAGHEFELDAVAAVAIGGTRMEGGRGRIIGSFFGIIILQMIESIIVAAKVPAFLTGLVKGIIIIVAVLMQGRKKESV